jgi:hypothetical protein
MRIYWGYHADIIIEDILWQLIGWLVMIENWEWMIYLWQWRASIHLNTVDNDKYQQIMCVFLQKHIHRFKAIYSNILIDRAYPFCLGKKPGLSNGCFRRDFPLWLARSTLHRDSWWGVDMPWRLWFNFVEPLFGFNLQCDWLRPIGKMHRLWTL